MSRACSTHGEEKEYIHKILVGKTLLGSHRRRWEDNIKMDIREIGWGGMDGLIWLSIETDGGLL
jgi:hypothetical protein